MRKTELQRFRKLLTEEKDRVSQSLAQHEKIIKHTDDQSGLEAGKSHSNHMADQGSDEFQYETTIKFANTEGRYLYNIEEALGRIEDPEGFLKGMHGGIQQTQEYLIQEVVARQSPRMRDWLLQTALLDRFCGPLCNAVRAAEPGAEQRMAISQAQDKNLQVLLIDREIGTTLKRTAHNLPWWKRWTLFSGLLLSLFSKEDVDEEEIEQLKQGDMLETTFSEFAHDRQDLYQPLIAERDQYMAARLLQEAQSNQHESILAVIGAGHLKGIAQQLRQGITQPEQTIKQLDQLPTPSRWPKLIPWIIVALVMTGFIIGFMRSPELGWQLISSWVLINGTLSAVGAAIAAAHPLTVLTAFVAAPITSLNPTIGAGMVTAAVELWLRKPTVSDFESLRSDTTGVIGWWKNRVSRTLLVFLLSTLGSAIGTYVAGFRIIDHLSGS